MAIDSEYFKNRINEKELSQPVSTQPEPQKPVDVSADQVARNLRSAINRAETEFYTKQAQRPAVSYIPQVTAEFVLGKALPNWGLDTKENIGDIGRAIHSKITGVSNEEYLEMSKGERITTDLTAGPRLAWNATKAVGRFVAGLPKNIVKAPIFLSNSAFNLLGRGLNKATGLDYWDYPDKVDLPVLGEVRTAGLSYDEGRELGMSPFFAAVKATGETASEALIGLASITDITKILTRPRNVVLKTKTIRNPMPLQGTAEDVINASGKNAWEVNNFSQSKDVIKIPISNAEAAKYKGNSNNTFAILKPKGQGLADLSIVQQRKSLLNMGRDAANNLFGKKNVIPGENGPLLKLRSEDIKYDPNFFNKQLSLGATLPAVVTKPGAISPTADLQTVLGNMGKKASSVSMAEAYQFYSPNVEENLTFDDALARLDSGNQILYNKIGQDVDQQLGHQSQSFNALGDWSDGAENTVFNAINKVNSFEELRYSTAIKGKIGKQKAVIPFMVQQGGADSLFMADIKNVNIKDIRAKLDELGISQRTLVPDKNGVKVVVFDPGSQLSSQMAKFEETFKVNVDIRKGQGEFLGDDSSREAGIAAFDQIIKGYEAGSDIVPAAENHYWPKTKDLIDSYLAKNPDSYAAKLFNAEKKSGDLDRAYARALSPDDGNVFAELPEELQNEWALKPAFDQETGETLTMAEHDTIRGTHIYNAIVDFENTVMTGETRKIYNQKTYNPNLSSKTQQPYAGKFIDPYTKARLNKKMPITAASKGEDITTPSIMAKPLKGFGDKPITDKQVDQVLGLSAELRLEEVVVQTIASVFTSKDNLYDLTQDELYQVSEIIRSFPKKETNIEPFDIGKFKSFFQLSRTWMSNVEIMSAQSGKIIPLDKEVRLPIEGGIRLGRNFRDEWNQKFNEVLGTYAKGKHAEDRRIISSYAAGDKASILNNPSLSQAEKLEMSRIGDWFIKYFEDSFKNKDLGLTYSRWVGTYLPQLKKAGGINLLYKEKEIPTELKVFAQYEREGQLNVLEDDILILAQVYNNAVSKNLFLKGPYEHAVKIISSAPDNIKTRASDWLQEVMGRRDDLEKSFNDWGVNLSKKTGGIIPENISKQILSLVLSNTYAGALGLPRFMPIVRNIVGQAFVMPYAEFGPRYFKSFVKWVNKDGFAELKRRGFDVKSGVIYGAEVAEKLGKGPIGKIVDYYKKVNEFSMISEGFPDLINRTATMGATIDLFDDAYKSFKDGKLDYDGFLQEINISGYSPTVRKVMEELIKEGSKDSIFKAQELAIKETLDALQFGYRKGSGAAFHHGLKGKALGQFTLFTWGYATLLKEWIARKQWEKLIRFLGMSANVKKSFEEELGIDVSKWVGIGPLSVPISPMVRIAMLATEGTANAVGGTITALNENYKEITRSLKLFLGVAGGVGVQRWEKLFDSVKQYEEGTPIFDPATGEKAFPLKAAAGKPIVPVSYGELLMYGAGFDISRIQEQFSILEQINKAANKQKIKEDEAMNAFAKGDFEEFNKIYIDNSLYFNPADRINSYQKGILQRVFERMDAREKLKWYNVVVPVIYGQR